MFWLFLICLNHHFLWWNITVEEKESTKEKTADKSKVKDDKELVDVTLDRAIDGYTIKVKYNGRLSSLLTS